MKSLLSLVCPLLLCCCIERSQGAEPVQEESAIPSGSYLGQEPPGTTAELFAPGLVSRDGYFEHSAAIFSPDLREVYWSALDRKDRSYYMYFMRNVDGKWTMPAKVPFLEHNQSELGPVFSPGGNTLYFNLRCDIWMVERQGDGWSQPVAFDAVNDPSQCERVAATVADGSLFFTRHGTTPGPEEIYVCRKTAVGYATPVKLDSAFSAPHDKLGGIHVAPDESYLVVELHLDPRTCGLFVSFKQEEGSWSDIVRLPTGWGRFPSVSPDGKYLFFMRREGIYWVSADIIEAARPGASQ